MLLFACEQAPKRVLGDYFSNRATRCTSKELKIDSLFIGFPGGIVLVDSLLIISDTYAGMHFSLVDIKNKKMLKRFGSKGKGPNEFMLKNYMHIIQKNGTFQFFALNEKKQFIYSITDLVEVENPVPKEIIDLSVEKDQGSYSTVVPYGNNKFIGNGWFYSGKYAITEAGGKLDTIIGSYHIDQSLTDVNNYVLGDLFQGGITLNPTGDKLAYFSISCDLIEVVDLKSDKVFEKRQFHTYVPMFEFRNNRLTLKRNNPFGFSVFCATTKYLYALYSGKDLSKGRQFLSGSSLLYVFDWNLNPIKAYRLDKETWNIAASEDDKTLYTIVESEQLSLAAYSLSH